MNDEQLAAMIERECGPVQRTSDMQWTIAVARAVLKAQQPVTRLVPAGGFQQRNGEHYGR